LGEICEVEAFPIPQEHSRLRFVWDHLRSLLTQKVYTAYVYQSEEFRVRLEQLIGSTDFDLVHADSLDLASYLDLVPDLPVVCVHHNVESMLLRRRAEKESAGWRRAYVSHQALLTEREEREWSERVALNVTVSEQDRRALEEMAPAGKYLVVPNGVDVEFFRPEPGRDEGLVFVGGNTWFPNRDALEYFCTDILPLIREQGAVAVRWVGRAAEQEVEEYRSQHGIELTGYVEDIRPYVRDAACYVVPLRVGGGTRLKILDAWAMGKAVVSTTIGCEGLEARDGENILVRDGPREFADAVRTVLGDADLRNRLAANARATVERLYSWNGIAGPMIERYMSLLHEDHGKNGAGNGGIDHAS
jgi:glycosyltransferase involved in cell wall biosynthesis